MRLLLTRPQDDAQKLAEILHSFGYETIIEPMLTIRFLPDTPVDLTGAQAVLITSANGARALAASQPRRAIPVYAVGEASAAAARALGFAPVFSAAGDVAALARLVADRLNPAGGALVHPRAHAVAGDLAGDLAARGFEVRPLVLYEAARATKISPATCAAIAHGEIDGVVFFSPRTARTFVRLAEAAALSLDRLVAWCLSPAVAEHLKGVTWRHIEIAAQPTQDSLLTLIGKPA
jgi:uroporphyrinogen-III synthase